MASADEGYKDERFESDVPHNFHCAICSNVLKQPMQCASEEHSFCRPCILRYLQKFQRCPSCMEPLTTQTLRFPRVITDLVSQLKITCDNAERGCPDIVKLENLEAHVANCQLSPMKCLNEGCGVIINRKDEVDQVDHENNEYITLQEKCEVCGENVAYGNRKLHCYTTKTEMGEVREEISSMKEIMRNVSNELTRHMGQMKHKMDGVTRRVNDFAVQMSEVKCEIDKIKRGQNMKQEPQTPTRSLDPPVAYLQHNVSIRNDVIIAGGDGSKADVARSVEMFSWPTRQWTFLPPMTSERYLSSSCVHEGQMFVCGGTKSSGDTIETLELNEGVEWKELQGKLPQETWGHASTNYKEDVLIFGGGSARKVVNDIYKVCLASPHSSQLVSRLPEPKTQHGAQRFGNKVAIVGGTTTGFSKGSVDTVLLYDIKRNCCRSLAPMPFAVCRMATVALGDNIIVIGGEDKYGNALNTVFSYNVKEQKSKMLPSMKQKRADCTAVVTDNVIIVMGGFNDHERYLKSVECFHFCTYVWEDLPPMGKKRCGATAVVKCG